MASDLGSDALGVIPCGVELYSHLSTLNSLVYSYLVNLLSKENTMLDIHLTCRDARRVRPKYIRGCDRTHDVHTGCGGRTVRLYQSIGMPPVCCLTTS